MVQFSNGRALAMALAIVPTIQRPDLSKSGCFYPDFKWFLIKLWPFVRILKFQIPFKIHLQPNLFSTIQNPD